MKSCVTVAEPEAYLKSLISESQIDQSIVYLRFKHEQYYLPDAAAIELLSAVGIEAGKVVWAIISPWSELAEEELLACDYRDDIERWAGERSIPCLDFYRAIALQPVSIPKPWGQEIWYTGIEARGLSCVGTKDQQIPLPWFLSLMPSALCGNNERKINLLKILDPLSEPVYGDLYYEQHQEKQEVYVVTHVDTSAWPDGTGGICIGFDDNVRREYPSDESCKSAFADAVAAYELVRRKIDSLMDEFRLQQGIALDQPVMSEQIKHWQERIPVALRDKEMRLRKAMDRFKGVKPLCVGDVLKVPCFTPHSLLHGVRTIEFQTPVYERQIISFAQKVLTQPSWDTSQALASMDINIPADDSLPVINNTGSILVEEVVSFDSFYVWRITLAAEQEYFLKSTSYALVMGVEGRANVCGLDLVAEQAAFVPGCKAGLESVIRSNRDGAVLLVSFPQEVEF